MNEKTARANAYIIFGGVCDPKRSRPNVNTRKQTAVFAEVILLTGGESAGAAADVGPAERDMRFRGSYRYFEFESERGDKSSRSKKRFRATLVVGLLQARQTRGPRPPESLEN